MIEQVYSLIQAGLFFFAVSYCCSFLSYMTFPRLSFAKGPLGQSMGLKQLMAHHIFNVYEVRFKKLSVEVIYTFSFALNLIILGQLLSPKEALVSIERMDVFILSLFAMNRFLISFVIPKEKKTSFDQPIFALLLLTAVMGFMGLTSRVFTSSDFAVFYSSAVQSFSGFFLFLVLFFYSDQFSFPFFAKEKNKNFISFNAEFSQVIWFSILIWFFWGETNRESQSLSFYFFTVLGLLYIKKIQEKFFPKEDSKDLHKSTKVVVLPAILFLLFIIWAERLLWS